MNRSEQEGHSPFLILFFDFLNCLCRVLNGFIECFLYYLNPPKPKSLSGEVALITGAGGGLGRELASQLTDLGVKVICVDINQDSVEETNRLLKKRGSKGCASFVCDVSNSKEVSSLVSKINLIENDLGRVTILVNNAGIAFSKPFLKHTAAEIESLFQVNVLSHAYLLKEYLPRFLEENKGHIVTVGSIAGSIGTPNLVPYCSTKFAIRGLTESLFLEMREMYPGTSVKMTTAHPYTISTNLITKPKNRFNTIFPIYSPGEVARVIIEAVQKDEETVMMPFFAALAANFIKVFPRASQLALLDFVGCGVDESD